MNRKKQSHTTRDVREEELSDELREEIGKRLDTLEPLLAEVNARLDTLERQVAQVKRQRLEGQNDSQ